MSGIDSLTVAEARELARLFGGSARQAFTHDFELNENVLIRTVTVYWTGKVIRETRRFVYLTDAAWVADTGRFNVAMTTGDLSEVEPVAGVVRVGKGAIADVLQWVKPLPRAAK